MQGFWNLLGKAGQGPGKDFQYEVNDKISSLDAKSLWSLHHGKKKVTGDLVSVFVCDSKEATPEEFELAKTACKRLKTLRHPNIIKFLDAFESDVLVYVVTEPVIPLSTFLDEEDGRNPNLITWGLHQVTTGLSFLINDGNLLHENVNIYSVFVGLDGEWKLGGVEYVHAANTDSIAKLPCLSAYDPPEKKSSNPRKEIWSCDAWGLGCLIWEIYNGALQSSSDLKIIKKIPKPLVIHYCDLVSANPKSRTNPKKFLEKTKEDGQFLSNHFIKANLFLQEIQIKDQTEQKEFFSSLDKTLDGFPKQFCIHKVLPQLLNAFEYGTAGSAVLSPLFKVGLLLDDAAYQTKIVPCIIKLFSSNDRATRIQLLQQMEKFVKHLQPAVVDTQIFPCISTGFGDTLPAMREQTIKAMLLLAPKLSEKTINNSLLRYFAKLQMDEQPGIRTNTTICLGRIAEHFSDATRQKVLIPAFTRGLRDPFAPARKASVMAISATQQFYNIKDIAGKILPALCSLFVDPDKSVRDNTFVLVKGFMKNLEEYSKDPNSALNNKEVAEKEANSQGSTWTGWAVTSITSRFYQPPKQEAQTPNKDNSEVILKDDDASQKESLPSKSTDMPLETTIAEHPSDSSDFKDAWEDDDEWGDVKEDYIESRLTDKVKPTKNANKHSAFGRSNFEKDDGNDSDSDYGEEWGEGGWNDSNSGGGWDGNETEDWGTESWNPDSAIEENSVRASLKNSAPKERSVADLLGMATDGNEFLGGNQNATTGNNWDNDWSVLNDTSSQFASKPFNSGEQKNNISSSSSMNLPDNNWDANDSSWGNDDFQAINLNDKNEAEKNKEQRKIEVQRKREERKLQREQANKEKRTAKSSGALKLGGVRK